MKNSNVLEEMKDEILRISFEYFKQAHASRIDKEVKMGRKKFVTIIENTEKPFMLIICESEE